MHCVLIMQLFLKDLCLFFAVLLTSALAGCSSRQGNTLSANEYLPDYLIVEEISDGGFNVISISPFDGRADTLIVKKSFESVVLMSTTHVGFLDAIGCDSVITGVSGLRYVCSPQLRKAAQEGRVKDVGYDAAPDYETILSLNPDLVLTYSVSGEMSRFENKLKSLGIRVFCINEHLERHPLARAAYLRLFGALTGRMAEADSVLAQVRGNYERIRSGSAGRASHLHVSQEVAQTPARPSRHAQGRARKVLVNIPYSDQWFIPGGDNYMTHLIEDAGGVVLGAGEGERQSSVISLEKAYALASEADCWLNVGPCTTLSQLEKENPVFPDMLRMIETNAESAGLGTGALVWNCNLRQNSSGGNDFWETGAARPDIVLSDLVSIFNGDDGEKVFYRPLK